MRRRDFVRVLASISLAPRWLFSQQSTNPPPPPPAPVPWTLGLNPLTPLPQTEVADGLAQTDLVFFSPQQMATLTRLSAVLLPPLGGKPGAVEAETPAFLDFLIGSSPAPRKNLYAGGLDWLDAEARQRHKTEFAKLDDAQMDALLKPLMRTWMTDHPPAEPHLDFVNIAHEDIRSATFGSEAWALAVGPKPPRTQLFWSPIEPDVYSASFQHPYVPPHVQAATKSSHTMPSYPR